MSPSVLIRGRQIDGVINDKLSELTEGMGDESVLVRPQVIWDEDMDDDGSVNLETLIKHIKKV